MRLLKAAAYGVTASLLAVPSASADVRLSIQNGRVSLVAKDATPRQILTEWGRIGSTKVVNVERVPGGPLTLELTNVPEKDALDVVLRAASGYMLSPRTVPAANLSQFDGIIVMPPSVAPRVTQTPVFQQPQLPQPVGDNEDDRRAVPAPGLAAPRGPIFNAFPQPQVIDPRGATPPVFGPGGPGASAPPPPQPTNASPGSLSSPVPTAPIGSSRPGEIVQPPPQPGRQPGVVLPPGPEAN